MPSWIIKNLKKMSSATDEAEITKQNVVQQIDAEYVDDDGNTLHQATVCLGLSNFSSHTEYADLTEQDCLDWVRNGLQETGQLDQIENPSIASINNSDPEVSDGLPWAAQTETP